MLSGRSIPLIQERGLASLSQLKNDLAPVVRPFLSSFLQLAINLADTQANPMDLWREWPLGRPMPICTHMVSR